VNDIKLRDINLDDSKSLFPIWNNKDSLKYTYQPYVISQDQCCQKIMELLEFNRKIDPNFNFGPFGIILNGSMIGMIGLEIISLELKEYELWYILSQEFWSKGITTKAVRIIVAKAFQEIEAERIFAEVVPDNIPSIKVLEKNHFKKEGCLRRKFIRDGQIRDINIYSILRDEYKFS